jgi:hypothetical protein
MLREAREEDRGVDVPDFMRAGIAHFCARIFELRRRGFDIENHIWRDGSGIIFSRYFLISDPERDGNER